MILINRTYEIVSPESAENSEAEEQGFICEDVEYSFKELVDLMQNYTQVSCSPSFGYTYEWLTNDPDIDYQTGNEETESLHYSRNNKPRSAKYWKLAMIAAGHAKRK